MIKAISASWCVWSSGVFHITGTTTRQLNSQIKTPTNPTYEPIMDRSSSATTMAMVSFLSLSLSFAFYLPLLELDLLVFLLLGLLVGFCRCRARAIAIELKERSHRPRRPGTNKMEMICGWWNKEVWVSACLFGIGFWFLVGDFLENNYKTQTISLVRKRLKLIWFLAIRVQRGRFLCFLFYYFANSWGC